MIIDGKAFAANLRAKIKIEAEALKASRGVVPGLTVIRVGDNPASEVYVRNKVKACLEVGMKSEEKHLPATVSEETLIAEIKKLNEDDSVHGILVQLPLPAHITEHAVINAVDHKKDVDGFHVMNAGKLATGQDGFVPCTPLGCVMLLKDILKDLSGKHAVVIGRSNIVGKPLAQLLLRENCTVTIAHSKTKDLAGICKQADILVAAVGKPEMVKADWIKKGAVVIDVGINRITLPDGKTKLVGDVDFEGAKNIAGAITPVPGGVGPMTIACLLANTLKAAQL